MGGVWVKLFFVILRLKFDISPVDKQVPGVGHMTAHLRRQLKFHFTSNHTQNDWASLEGHSIITNHIRQGFGEKQEVSDQLPQWKMPSVYSICYKIFLWGFCYFVQRNINNCMLDLMWPLICFISFQIFPDGCILGTVSGSTYVTFVDVNQLIKVKQKA